MSYRGELAFILFGPGENYRLRAAGVLSIFTDTLTTLYLLFFSGLPVAEFNPLGSFLLVQGFVGDTLFMSIPLFSILVLLYLPGILGDAVALTTFIVHSYATLINLSHAAGVPIEAFFAVTAYQAYVFTLIASSVFSLGWYLPRLRERSHRYQDEAASDA